MNCKFWKKSWTNKVNKTFDNLLQVYWIFKWVHSFCPLRFFLLTHLRHFDTEKLKLDTFGTYFLYFLNILFSEHFILWTFHYFFKTKKKICFYCRCWDCCCCCCCWIWCCINSWYLSSIICWRCICAVTDAAVCGARLGVWDLLELLCRGVVLGLFVCETWVTKVAFWWS